MSQKKTETSVIPHHQNAMALGANWVNVLAKTKFVTVFKTAAMEKTRKTATNGTKTVIWRATVVSTPWSVNFKLQSISYSHLLFSGCSRNELKCKTGGKCVPKSNFCNAQNDCADGSDEPARCSCRAYLELTDPAKICDGNVHCKDRTDEKFCDCAGSTFKCKRLDRSNIFQIELKRNINSDY